jgi:hypothetical protein
VVVVVVVVVQEGMGSVGEVVTADGTKVGSGRGVRDPCQ